RRQRREPDGAIVRPARHPSARAHHVAGPAAWRPRTWPRSRRRASRAGRGCAASRAAREPPLLCRLPRRRWSEVAVPAAARARTGHGGGNDLRSIPCQHEDRWEDVRGSQVRRRAAACLLGLVFAAASSVAVPAQTRPTTGRLLITVADQTNAVLPGAT